MPLTLRTYVTLVGGTFSEMGRLLRVISVPFHPERGPRVRPGSGHQMGQGSDRKPVPKLSQWILKRAADLLEVSCQQLSIQEPPSLAATKQVALCLGRTIGKAPPAGFAVFPAAQSGAIAAGRNKRRGPGESGPERPKLAGSSIHHDGQKPLVLFA